MKILDTIVDPLGVNLSKNKGKETETEIELRLLSLFTFTFTNNPGIVKSEEFVSAEISSPHLNGLKEEIATSPLHHLQRGRILLVLGLLFIGQRNLSLL